MKPSGSANWFESHIAPRMCPPTNRQGSVAEPGVRFRIVHYYGSYSNAHRRKSLRRQALTLPNPEEAPPKPEPEPAWLKASRNSARVRDWDFREDYFLRDSDHVLTLSHIVSLDRLYDHERA